MPEESYNQPNDSSPFGSDEFPVDEHAFGGAHSEPSVPRSSAGNRPAEGARQVSPDEILSTGFEGSENAGDFLGLDLEFTGAMADLGADLELAAAPTPMPAPAAAVEADYDAEFDLDGPTHIMHADDESDYDDYDGYHEDGDDEFGLDESFEGADEVKAGGRGKLIAIAFGIGALAFAGVTIGPRFLAKDVPAPVDVAHHVQPAPVETGTPDEDVELAANDTETDPLSDAGADSAVDPTATQSDPLASTTPVETAGDDVATGDALDTANDALAAAVDGAKDGANGFGSSPIDVLLQGDDQTGAPDSVDPNVAASVGMAANPESFPAFDAGYEWVGPDMLDMVWRGTEIPMEAIAAPTRTLMPRVGQVRVHMTSGETIDGRLYAVGQNRVWVEIEPGRIGLDGDEVASFEHLATPQTSTGVAKTSPLPKGGLVSAEAPGGLIFGRILAQEGNTVTLVCEDGAKVTLHDPVLKPVTANRAVLVQR